MSEKNQIQDAFAEAGGRKYRRSDSRTRRDTGEGIGGYTNQPSLNSNNTPTEDHKGSILSKIAPKLNTAVTANPVSNQSININQANVGANITANRTKVAAVGQDVQNVKNSISTTIQSAQQMVIGIMKTMGPEYQTAFMDRSMGGTGIGVLANAAFGGTSPSLFADLLYSEFRGKNNAKGRAQMVTEILDKVRDASTPGSKHPDSKSNLSYAMPIAPLQGTAPTFDFSDINEQELEALMFADPNNLNEEQFPEIKTLNAIEYAINDVNQNLDKAEKEFAKGNTLETSLPEAVALTSFPESGVNAPTLASNTDVKQALAKLHNEPAIKPSLSNAFALGGMTA